MDQKKQLNFYWWNSWIGGALAVLVVVTAPILVIAVRLFSRPGQSWGHIASHLLPGYFSSTALLLAGTAIGTLIIGVVAAWVISSYDFPGCRHFEWLLILPLGFPGYIMGYTYAGMLDYTGPLQSFLRQRIGIHFAGSIVDILNLPGAIFILSITLYPYVYLVVRASFLNRIRTLQEASWLLGKNRLATFWRVALPMARPALVAGVALALMEVLNDYGTVRYFGINTFTTGIFRAWFSLGDITTAVYLAAILMVGVFILLFVETRQRGARRFSGDAASVARPVSIEKATGWRGWGLSVFCGVIFALGFLLPFLQLLYWSRLTFSRVVDLAFLLLMFRSFSLAAVSGVLIAGLALVMLYAIRLSPFRWVLAMARVATLGYAVPGAVIAIGVMIPVLALDRVLHESIGWGWRMSGSVAGLLFAYAARFLAVAYHPIESGFQKTGIHVHEASRLLGAGSVRTLWQIELPLLRSSLLAGALLVFVDVLKELPLTLILRPFNYHTLATKAFDMATNEMIPESANAALIIILTGVFPIILMNRMIRGKSR